MNEPNNETIYDEKQKPMMTRTKTTNNQKKEKTNGHEGNNHKGEMAMPAATMIMMPLWERGRLWWKTTATTMLI